MSVNNMVGLTSFHSLIEGHFTRLKFIRTCQTLVGQKGRIQVPFLYQQMSRHSSMFKPYSGAKQASKNWGHNRELDYIICSL